MTAVVIDMKNPRHKRFVFLTVAYGRLKIEINTGMRFGKQSTLIAVNRYCGTTFTRKSKALEHVKNLLDTEYPGWQEHPTSV